LNSEPVFVDGNLLDQVSTLDPDLLLRHQVLDDHVGHVLEEKSWSISVEKLERFSRNIFFCFCYETAFVICALMLP
jgi:hypothetical protein